MKFSYKIFRTGSDTLLAIADMAILGRKYSEGELQLEVKKDFYSENRCSENDIARLVKSATIVNAVGKDIIAVLTKNKIIDEDNVLYINGMPHAQIITLK